MKIQSQFRLVMVAVFLSTGLGNAEPGGGSGGGKPPGGDSAEGAKHMACMTKRSDAMGDVKNFAPGSTIAWPVMRVKFAKNNLKMMTSIVEEFLCHMKIELSDSIATLPVSATKTMTPGGSTGTAISIVMTLDAASSDTTLDGKGYDYVATTTINGTQVAKIAWAGVDASTKGEASFSNLQSSMGVNSNAPKSEQMFISWDTKGETSDEVLGTSKQVKALYNRQFGIGFMGDVSTGKGGMIDEAGYIEQTIASDGGYTLKAGRVTADPANAGQKIVDNVIANIAADGTGTVAATAKDKYIATTVTGAKPSEMGMVVSNVNMTTGVASSANAAKTSQFDGSYYQMPPAVTPSKMVKMGEAGGAFDSTSGNSKGNFTGAPGSMMPPPPPK